ncbi:MAG: GNAT family N-acetyltransferase [Planctomycetota bacterium]|jgi:predicted GNAT superfamily acetyltransferase
MKTIDPGQPPAGYDIRDVASIDELEACELIQKSAFGYDDLDVVPTNELLSIQKAGGLCLAAFPAGEGRPVAFAFGIVGLCESGEPYHYSRMVAVVSEHRRKGLARALKLAQRARCLEQGLSRMRWTFDPLRRANALLNLNHLGAVGIRYHRMLFGEATSSPLHLGIGTDRLLVEWDLQRPPGVTLDDVAAAGAERVQLPIDIGYLQRDMPELALSWRDRVREGLEDALSRGCVVVAVDSDEVGTPYYVLRPRVGSEQVPAKQRAEGLA